MTLGERLFFEGEESAVVNFQGLCTLPSDFSACGGGVRPLVPISELSLCIVLCTCMYNYKYLRGRSQ